MDVVNCPPTKTEEPLMPIAKLLSVEVPPNDLAHRTLPVDRSSWPYTNTRVPSEGDIDGCCGRGGALTFTTKASDWPALVRVVEPAVSVPLKIPVA
jgi:hypothetical protein